MNKSVIKNIEHHLNHIDFPVHKSDLLEHFRVGGRGDDVVDVISGLPDREFKNSQEVMKILGNKSS